MRDAFGGDSETPPAGPTVVTLSEGQIKGSPDDTNSTWYLTSPSGLQTSTVKKSVAANTSQ